MTITKAIVFTSFTLNILYCGFVNSRYSALHITELRLAECATTLLAIESYSINDYYHNINNCFLDLFLICTTKQTTGRVDKFNTGYQTLGICGVLSSYFVNANLPWRFYLNVMRDFNMNLMILSFHLPWIYSGCPVYGMTVDGNILRKNDSRSYCGKRNPWSQVYDNTCSLAIYGSKMFQINVYIYFSLVIKRNILSDMSFCSIDPASMLTFQDFVDLLSGHTSVIARVVTKPYMLFIMHYRGEHDAQHFYIRDGPGNLSPFVVADYNNGKMRSTAYIVSIYFKIYTNITKIEFFYRSISAMDSNDRDQIPCMHVGGIRSMNGGVSSDDILYNSSSTANTACHIFYSSYSVLKILTFPQLHIKHYQFLGNTVFNESLWTGCQYGGMFTFSVNDQGTVQTIQQFCNNLEDVLPSFIMSGEQTLLVSMIWFPPYSSGFFRGSINMTPCKYRNITVTHSTNPNITHLVDYSTSCEIIGLDAPKNESTNNFINIFTITVTNVGKIVGPAAISFKFRDSSSFEEVTCIQQLAVNMTFFKPWLPFIEVFSYDWQIGYNPFFDFGVLQRASITVSRCLLSKGSFVIMLEKPFCHTLGKQDRAPELIANSMLLLRTCSEALNIRFKYTRKLIKFVKLPEDGDHKTVLYVEKKTECSVECNRYQFSLLEYRTHVGILCEYIIDIRGHKTMTFISVNTQEPFMMVLRDRVNFQNKYQCLRKKCSPMLTKTDKAMQNNINERFQQFIPFTKRCV